MVGPTKSVGPTPGQYRTFCKLIGRISTDACIFDRGLKDDIKQTPSVSAVSRMPGKNKTKRSVCYASD